MPAGDAEDRPCPLPAAGDDFFCNWAADSRSLIAASPCASATSSDLRAIDTLTSCMSWSCDVGSWPLIADMMFVSTKWKRCI